MTRPTKPDFFMGLALCAAARSNDPKTKVGACIVKNDRVVSIGYNGMPNECDGKFPWGKGTNDQSLDSKMMYVCHAEMNAIVSSRGSDLHDATIYVTHTPCNECAKIIVQSGIKKVLFLIEKFEDDSRGIAAHAIFQTMPDVECKQLTPKIKSMNLHYDNGKGICSENNSMSST